jgi:hypothetical protein
MILSLRIEHFLIDHLLMTLIEIERHSTVVAVFFIVS